MTMVRLQNARRNDPVAMVRDLEEHLNRAFGGAASADVWTPAVEVFETDEAYVVEADLPGFAKDAFRIEAAEGQLLLAGERKREEAQARQERYKRIKPLKNKLDRMEKEIAELEAKKGDIESALADEATYRDEEKARDLTWRYKEIGDTLARAYKEWESLQTDIDTLEREYG